MGQISPWITLAARLLGVLLLLYWLWRVNRPSSPRSSRMIWVIIVGAAGWILCFGNDGLFM